jgi:EAL domain-containing protein (putative c-di-GMP-specific phosphodiesterase class I)
MYDPGVVDALLEALDRNALHPEDLLLEVTESAYTQDSDQIIDTVNILRGLGFRVEMDDFGTGYSSLNMLSSLPIDVLKLDMRFMQQENDGLGNIRMVKLMIDIADYLEVPVVAEGVETMDQMAMLKDLGCDMVQGYCFSKPLPADEFEALVCRELLS